MRGKRDGETNVTFRLTSTYTIVVVRFFVLLSGETRQSIFVDEDPKGIARGHCHIDAEIEFETIDEKRLETKMNVSRPAPAAISPLTRLT